MPFESRARTPERPPPLSSSAKPRPGAMIDARTYQVLPQTLLDMLDARAARHARRTAHAFCRDAGERFEHSYGDLHRPARPIPAHPQPRLAPGERVLWVFPPGL